MLKPQLDEMVRDYPSDTIRQVIDVYHCDERTYYLLDLGTPLDPTGDGAFPTAWRCDFELGPADQPRPSDWTY